MSKRVVIKKHTAGFEMYFVGGKYVPMKGTRPVSFNVSDNTSIKAPKVRNRRFSIQSEAPTAAPPPTPVAFAEDTAVKLTVPVVSPSESITENTPVGEPSERKSKGSKRAKRENRFKNDSENAL